MKEEIKNEVDKLTESCFDNYIFDVKKACNKLGIKLLEAEFTDSSISGIICKDKEDYRYSIYVNKEHSIARKRFTICHELGHFISYKQNSLSKEEFEKNNGFKDQNNIIHYRSESHNKSYCEIESEANEIAAALLMPENLIERYIKYNPNCDIENIANSFYVSTTAMSVRLKKLKYINNDYV
jgi:Zn-dependent peptidase ImmA (M78 family)